MGKYVLYITSDGICDIDETDIDINDEKHITIDGFDNAVNKRNEINVKNGFGVVSTSEYLYSRSK